MYVYVTTCCKLGLTAASYKKNIANNVRRLFPSMAAGFDARGTTNIEA